MDTRTYSDKELKRKKRVSDKTQCLIAAALTFTLLITVVIMSLASNQLDAKAMEANKALTESKSASSEEINLAKGLREAAVDEVIDREAIPAYSTAQVMALDVSVPSGVTVSDLKLVTQGALVGLEEAFWKAEQDYGVNCLFVMAIAAHESANGTICFRPNNMFGFGTSGFSSKAECIDTVARALANNYLSTSGSLYNGKTISSVNKRYAASTTWDDKVARNMVNYYSVISRNHNAALEELK